MVVGLLGNKSPDSNRLTLVTPKSENDVRLQAKLGNQNPTGLPVGVVSMGVYGSMHSYLADKFGNANTIGSELWSVELDKCLVRISSGKFIKDKKHFYCD